MTRSLRVSHASVAKRDPHLASGVEQLLSAKVGLVSAVRPTAMPWPVGSTRVRNRIAVAPLGSAPLDTGRVLAGDDELVALGGAAGAGAGLVVTPPIGVAAGGTRLNTDEQAVAWAKIVEYVHGKGAAVVARLATNGAVLGAVESAVQRAAFAGFDVLLLDPCGDVAATEHLPAMVAAARGKFRGWVAAAVHDRPAVMGHAAQLVRAGASLLWVTGAGDITMAGARLPAAPLADRLRNELHVATCVDGAEALLPDLDAAIAAGRADLVVVRHVPR
jgi:2,4-dienoyl-CoA reductase-like NADH-dependent reductase (Old Yellow Enzyme family)